MSRYSEIKRRKVSEWEAKFIRERLVENQWNVSKTARALGIERANLCRLMRLHGIKRPKPE
jgi:two-component system nitrogen regulation response regulator NtrX